MEIQCFEGSEEAVSVHHIQIGDGGILWFG